MILLLWLRNVGGKVTGRLGKSLGEISLYAVNWLSLDNRALCFAGENRRKKPGHD